MPVGRTIDRSVYYIITDNKITLVHNKIQKAKINMPLFL